MTESKLNINPQPLSSLRHLSDTVTTVLINPIDFRSIIFRAVKETHPEECRNRAIHYDTHRYRSKVAVETTRPFVGHSYYEESDLSVSKQGARYFVTGVVARRETGEINHVQGYIRTIPRRYYLSHRMIEKGTCSTIKELKNKVDSLQTELDKLKQERDLLLSINNSIVPPIDTPPTQCADTNCSLDPCPFINYHQLNSAQNRP